MATYPADPSTRCTDCGRDGAHECPPPCEECDGTGYNSENHSAGFGCETCGDEGQCAGPGHVCRACNGTRRADVRPATR